MALVRHGRHQQLQPKKSLTLARLLAEHPDELEADFRQFYGLDLGGMGTDFTVAHAAVLASQLPRDSRCLRAIDPDLAWSDETMLLSLIEYLLRCLMYGIGGGKGEKPKPMKTPSEQAGLMGRLEDAREAAGEVARALGIT